MTHLRRIQTARDSDRRLSEIAPLILDRSDGPPLPLIDVDRQGQCQEILGFGGAFSESACTVLAALPEEAREAVLRAYFDPHHGLGRAHGVGHGLRFQSGQLDLLGSAGGRSRSQPVRAAYLSRDP